MIESAHEAMQKSVVFMNCPVCGSVRHKLRHTFRGGYQTRVCEGCTAEFLSPRPTPQAISALYDEKYFNNDARVGYIDYAQERGSVMATAHRRLGIVAKHTQGRMLLDVGAAFGYTLEQAALDGWKGDGVEPSTYAFERMQQHASHPFNGTLEEFADVIPYRQYDVITAFDTLEHIYSPKDWVSAAYKMLAPNGLLVIAAPDRNSTLGRLSGRSWWSYKVPEHLTYFNQHSMERLLRGQFKIVHSEPDKQVVSGEDMHRRADRIGGIEGVIASIILLGLLSRHKNYTVPNGMRLYIARKVGA